MDVSIVDITDVTKEIHIQASPADLAPHFEQAFKKHQASFELPGFRKGKAPLHLVKRIHGEAIEYNSLDTITNEIYRNEMDTRGIHPIGEPTLTDIDYKRGESLSFKVKYEIKPMIVLKEYKKIAVEKPVHKINEKEIEDELLRLRKANSTMEPADSVTDDEHIVTADVQQLDETDAPIIGKNNPDTRLYLAGGTLYAEIKEALIGIKVGDVKKVTIEREHDGHTHKDQIEITAKKIEKVVIPEMTDDLIKKATKEKVATVQEFRQQMEKDLEQYWSDTAERALLDGIIREIVNRHEFNVPDSLVKSILDSMIDDLKNRYPNKKLPPEFNEEQYRESNNGYALFQAKWFLIQEQLIETENITVEDADYEALAEKEASRYGIEKDRLIQFYRSSDSVKNRLQNDKLMTLLKANAVITEKIVEEPPHTN
jgi:trigger factor